MKVVKKNLLFLKNLEKISNEQEQEQENMNEQEQNEEEEVKILFRNA